MRAVFIESSEFTAWVSEYLPDESYAALQRELLAAPEKGTPMPGCGGLRKIRTPDPRRGKGKRGGARVIYLHVPEANVILLMDIYGKGEQEDLSAGQKKILKALAEQYKRDAIRQTKREETP
jgi:mRNA-degrading endonuclease RelE of RelBE toxin-antitoxin system